jgi:hypothetical protein
MYLFSKLFLETTDPLTPISRLFQLDVSTSILFHTILYLFLIKLVTNLLNIDIKPKLYQKLCIVLIITMVFGYYFRLHRVKSLYKVYIESGINRDMARKLSIGLLHKGYMTYYFLG